MHKNTKLAPALREQVYKEWKSKKYSLRELASRYHVDKRVISRIVERGKKGDFSIHSSVNVRYKKSSTQKTSKKKNSHTRSTKKTAKRGVVRTRSRTTKGSN